MSGPVEVAAPAPWRPVAEVAAVLGVGVIAVAAGWSLAGDDPFARQAAVWVANVLMLSVVWLSLRRRGHGWTALGLGVGPRPGRTLLRALLLSVPVLVAAVAAFVAGSAVAAWVPAAPGAADMSGYAYLQGNLPMLLLALAAVYVVSSFGEEVIYRGFLMHRVAELGAGTGPAWAAAVAVSAVVFGLVHFDWGIVGVVQTTLMGLVLAGAYLLVGRRLWPLVLAHVWIDTLLLLQLYLGPE